ncbi:MAG: GNAT family N-acetyltransferase [Acidimicrobiales bacterium]
MLGTSRQRPRRSATGNRLSVRRAIGLRATGAAMVLKSLAPIRFRFARWARTIRPALASDAETIGLVHLRSWQAAYRGKFPQEFLDQLDPVQRADGWRRYFAEAPWERQAVIVVEVDSAVVGFANVGPSRDSDAKDEGEVRAIYLLPERWGGGLGRDLMATATTELNELGSGEAIPRSTCLVCLATAR